MVLFLPFEYLYFVPFFVAYVYLLDTQSQFSHVYYYFFFLRFPIRNYKTGCIILPWRVIKAWNMVYTHFQKNKFVLIINFNNNV